MREEGDSRTVAPGPGAGRTLPQLLLGNRERWGERSIALRTKEYGVWNQVSWGECCDRTKAIFQGLRSLGLGTGTRACILGRNSLPWFLCEMAVLAAGGVVAGIDEGLSEEDTARLMMTAGADLAFAEDQGQVHKLLAIRARLPQLQRVVHWRAPAVDRYQDPFLLSLAGLMRLGEAESARRPQDFEDCVAKGRSEDAAIQFLTPGRGEVKSVTATHQFLLSFAESALAGGVDRGRKRPEYVALASPCWFFEQSLGYAGCLLQGQVLNFPERRDTASLDFREISPQVIARPPQAWDAVASAMSTNLRSSTRLKSLVSRCGLSIGRRSASLPAKHGPTALVQRLLLQVAELTVYGPLRDKHGLNRARLAYVAGGPASEETRLLFTSLNLNLREIYCSLKGGMVTADPGEEAGLS